MAYSCHYCNKRALRGHNVSHANNRTIKLSMPNLQTIRVLLGKTVRRVRACTRCLRSGVVVKAG
ncbi:MAG: 50S ribosomal protein L28 [Deltaproteobacteria bacterium]|nr:50S ribosomal protein L28 [Deltaproteobacteria bacterium]